MIWFQVVPPCGGHPLRYTVQDGNGCFKACPRVGGIRYLFSRRRYLRSFKSCPRVGGIPPGAAFFGACRRFKSCPRVGGIVEPAEILTDQSVSSRAPVWGASRIAFATGASMMPFQVVPPCGGHLPHIAPPSIR